MRLQLTDTLIVVSDNYQYILKEQKVSESEKLYEANLGYYGTIHHLVRGLLEKEIKNAPVNDLMALNERLDVLETSITKQIEKGLDVHVKN